MAQMNEEAAAAILAGFWRSIPPLARLHLITGAAQALADLRVIRQDEIRDAAIMIRSGLPDDEMLEQDLPGLWSNSDFGGGESGSQDEPGWFCVIYGREITGPACGCARWHDPHVHCRHEIADQPPIEHLATRDAPRPVTPARRNPYGIGVYDPSGPVSLDQAFAELRKANLESGQEPGQEITPEQAQGLVLRFRQAYPRFHELADGIRRGSQSPDEPVVFSPPDSGAASVHDRLCRDPDAPWWCSCEDAPDRPHIHCPWPSGDVSGWHLHFISPDQLPAGWQVSGEQPGRFRERGPDVHYAGPQDTSGSCGVVLRLGGEDALASSGDPDKVTCRWCRTSGRFQADLPEPGHDAEGVARHLRSPGLVIHPSPQQQGMSPAVLREIAHEQAKRPAAGTAASGCATSRAGLSPGRCSASCGSGGEMAEFPVITRARRVATFDDLKLAGDYTGPHEVEVPAPGTDFGRDGDATVVKRFVWYLLPVHTGPDKFGDGSRGSGVHGCEMPPWVFRECDDGSLEIRESIGCGGQPYYWHGYLDEGNIWRQIP